MNTLNIICDTVFLPTFKQNAFISVWLWFISFTSNRRKKKERKADLSVKVRTNEQKLYTVRTVINRCVPKPNHLSSNERLTVVNKNWVGVY